MCKELLMLSGAIDSICESDGKTRFEKEIVDIIESSLVQNQPTTETLLVVNKKAAFIHPLTLGQGGSTPSVPISIVSNSRLLCEGLVPLLQVYHAVHLVGSYAGNIDITIATPNPVGHVVLLDSSIGCAMTVTRIQQWRSLLPLPYIIVLELCNDVDKILACIEAGAHGYTLQGASSAEVARVIQQTCQGIARCSPEVTARLFARLVHLKDTQLPKLDSRLTPRELDVLRCIAKNYSDREIAIALVVEVCTVKHHIHNLLRKLNVKHRWDAARLAIEQGWIECESKE